MHHHSSDTTRVRPPTDIVSSADAVRKDYLSRVCKHLQTEDITHGEGTALTYEELSGRSGAKLVSFREQSVLFTSPSTPAKIHYVRRTIDKEAKYSDVGELAKELLRQTAGRTKDKQILLYGTPGSGKSRACEHLTWTLADRAARDSDLPIPVLIDFRVFGSPELLSIAPSLATLSTAEQGRLDQEPSRSFNIRAVRRLLTAAFTEKELRRFCADQPVFQGVTSQFGSRDNLEDVVDTLIVFCQKKVLLDELLSAVEKENPRQYQRHKGALFQSVEPSRPPEGDVERQIAEDFMFEVARRAIEDRLGREMARQMEPLLSRYTHDGDLVFIIDSTNEVSPQIFDGLWWTITKFARTTAVACGFVVAIREYAVRPGWPGRFVAICALSDDQVRGFVALYLDPTHTSPEKVEQFMTWLQPPGRELPVIARTPFYLWMLTKWFRSRHGRQGWEVCVPKLPVLMGAYVESQLLDKAGCPPNELHNVEGTLQGLAFQATLRDAVGTRIQEDELKQGTYSRGLPADYEQRLAYAEKARLIHRLGGYLRFDHHRLQEYFAARAWLAVFRFRPGAEIEETIKDVQWEDTIRLAVALADNPEEILQVIYGPAKWQYLRAPDWGVSWPIRNAIPEHQLQFDTSGKLVDLFRRETQRFYLALRCLSELDDLGNPTLHGKSKSIANEWIVWAETVLANGPASEGITTAEILGEIPWPAAAQALTATLPEVFQSHPFSEAVPHYPWGFAVQAQALKSLLRHRDAGIKEASEILDRISKKAPDLFVQAALQDTPILRKILKYWQMLRPSSRRVLDPLALAASDALRGKAGYSTKEMLGFGLLILVCYLAYALGQAVLSLLAASPLPSFFDRLGSAISRGLGRVWDPIGNGLESLGTAVSRNLFAVITTIGILLLILIVYRLARVLVVFFADFRRGFLLRRSTNDLDHRASIRAFPQLFWGQFLVQSSRLSKALREIPPRLRDSGIATIIRYTWRAMVAAIIAAPFAIPFVGWAINIVYLMTGSSGELATPDSYEDMANTYWSLTYTKNLGEWWSGLNHPTSAAIMAAVLLYWPFLWIIELTRYVVGIVKQGVWRKAIQNETTIFEEFKISVAASVGSAIFALGPSAIFLWMIWRVRQGPFGWFVTAGREVLGNFVSTRITVLSLFTLQTCVAVFLVGLWPILFLRRWRHVIKLRREQAPNLLLKRVADENEWKILRITAMRRIPEVDWVGQPPGATEVRAVLMRIEAQDSDYTVRREAALVLSKLHAEERFVLRHWGQGKPNHKKPSDLSVDR